MVNISIDVTDLGGEARPGDKVVLWKPAAAGSSTHAGRVISTAPVDVFLTNGKATVPDVEPGEMRVLLQCRGVESQGPIDVTVPDGTGTVTLRSLIESQFEYAPPIVSAVQEAAANASASERAAIEAQVRSEAAADRADAKVDDAINNGAALVRNEVKQDADRAVSARQAATQSESNAKASENAAASSASSAKTSETNAKQSETNAGDYAAVATTAATEAVDAMDSVSDIIGAKYATQEYVDNSRFDRPSLGAGSVDNYFGETWAGAHGIDNAITPVANITGLPFTNAFGQLLVLVSDQGHTTQIVTCNSGAQAGSMWLRGQSALNQPVWHPWRKILDERSNPYRGDIPANTDWNDMWGTEWRGKWSADNGTGNGNMGTWSNMPEFRQGELEVSVSDVGFTTHTFKTVNGSVWTRGQGTIARGDRWTPWVNIVDPEVDESHFEHDLRVDRARHRSAPVAVPKRTVAVVLDHGTNAFNSTFLKMFTDRNIPVTIALNGDMYNPDDVRYQYNNLTSWADVKRWHDDHGVEIANHGMTHGNVTDPDEQEWEVTESLKVLEENLPGVPIDSWVGPAGLTLVNNELGFMEHAGTRAMYAKHAVVVSAVTPQHWPLTGEPRVGMSRYWIDSPTGANSSTRNALLNVPSGHGTMVSFHPETVGQSGKSTVADIEGFLDWLVSQRDAGEFTLLTLREAAFAEYKPPAATKPFLWADMNDAVIEGDYDIARYADVRDLANRPPTSPIPAAASITVRRAGGARLIQEWTGIISGGIGERWIRNRNSLGEWEAWALVHSDISRSEVLSLLDEFKPAQTDHVVTVGDSQVGATYGWANLLAGISGQTVVNRGKSGNTPDEALLMTGGWRLPIEPVSLAPGERVPVSFAGDYPVLGRDFSHNGYVLGKRVSLWYKHSTGGWEALLNAEEDPLTLSSPTLWASIYADFAPERLSRRIVWFGGNSIRTGRHRPDESLVEHVQKAYSRAIDAWGETTIVCGYVPAYGDAVGRDAANELNTWLSRTVPTQFLDMRYRIQLAAADILGRDLTTSEQSDIANGYLPRPLYRSDLVHLTDEAHVKIAEIVAEFPRGASPQVSIRSNPAPVVSLTGAGVPEGKVSAAVGSIYTDTAATNGAIRWIKSSGAGSTGWKVEYGDTGWRDITTLMTSSPAIVMGTGGKIAIRRMGGSVFFRVIGPATMGGTFGNIVAAQPGLRPDLDTNSPAAKGASFRNTRSWIRLEDGTRDVVLTESGRAVETMWSTTEAWPATLPGTPF